MELIDPRLFTELQPNYFVQLVAIYQRSATVDAISQPEYTYTIVLPGHSAIRCYPERQAGSKSAHEEMRRADIEAFESIELTTQLDGYYPLIDITMRAVISGISYEIRSVTHSGSKDLTKLALELVQ